MSGRWGPYRQASPPPARHRPGARSARRMRCHPHYSADRTAKETTMLFRPLPGLLTPRPNPRRPRRATLRPRTSRLAVETLEDRWTPAAMLSIGDMAILEGNAGTQNVQMTVNLTEPHGNSVTVNYNTVDGSAAAGSDYTAASGTLTFTKNVMSKSI